MAIRNPAARNSAVVPKHVTTRVVRRAKGYMRRSVYARGAFVGYVQSSLGAHRALTKDGVVILDGPNEYHTYLSDAIVAVALEAEKCKGFGEACGSPTGDSDLCPDCTTARLDVQSPRIPA